MELGAYLAILSRRKWVIAVTATVTVIIVVIGTLMATPGYEASTTLRVATVASGSSNYADLMYAERLMNTQVSIATSGPVLKELVQRLGVDKVPQIAVKIIPNTELIQITVSDRDPILTSKAANALAEILVAKGKELYVGGGKPATEILSEQLAQAEEELNEARKDYESLIVQSPQDSERATATSQSIALKEESYGELLDQYEQARVREAMQASVLSVIEPAVPPLAPSKPRKALNIALGAIVGLVGGVGLAFVFENLDTTLYTTEQIEAVTELSTLGQIPVARGRRRITLFNGNSPQAEAFRRLRAHIFALDHGEPPQTLLVTSAQPGEGKSTVVANLALTIAQSDRRVIVVDADLRRPTLHKIFGMTNEIGLSSVLRQEATLDQAVQDSKTPGVHLLASGPLPPNPTELLGSPQMATLIRQLAGQFDLILLDTPAFLAVTDATVLASVVDGVILVVGRGQSQRKVVQAARRQLADIKASLVGAVVNRAARDSSYDYYQRSK
jgi:succinoglycan biosynthesis transport protein ExoP